MCKAYNMYHLSLVQEFSETYKDVVFCKVDVDENDVSCTDGQP